MASPALNKLFLELLVSKNKLSLLRSYYIGIKDNIVSKLDTLYSNLISDIDWVDRKINDLAVDKSDSLTTMSKFVANTDYSLIVNHEKYKEMMEKHNSFVNDFYKRMTALYTDYTDDFMNNDMGSITNNWKFHYSTNYSDATPVMHSFGPINITKESEIFELTNNRFIYMTNDNVVYDVDYITKNVYIITIDSKTFANQFNRRHGNTKNYYGNEKASFNTLFKLSGRSDVFALVNIGSAFVEDVSGDIISDTGDTSAVQRLIPCVYDHENHKFNILTENTSEVLVRGNTLKNNKIEFINGLYNDFYFYYIGSHLVRVKINGVSNNDSSQKLLGSSILDISTAIIDDDGYLIIPIAETTIGVYNLASGNNFIDFSNPTVRSFNMMSVSSQFVSGEVGKIEKLFYSTNISGAGIKGIYCVTDRSIWFTKDRFSTIAKDTRTGNISITNLSFSNPDEYIIDEFGYIYVLGDNARLYCAKTTDGVTLEDTVVESPTRYADKISNISSLIKSNETGYIYSVNSNITKAQITDEGGEPFIYTFTRENANGNQIFYGVTNKGKVVAIDISGSTNKHLFTKHSMCLNGNITSCHFDTNTEILYIAMENYVIRYIHIDDLIGPTEINSEILGSVGIGSTITAMVLINNVLYLGCKNGKIHCYEIDNSSKFLSGTFHTASVNFIDYYEESDKDIYHIDDGAAIGNCKITKLMSDESRLIVFGDYGRVASCSFNKNVWTSFKGEALNAGEIDSIIYNDGSALNNKNIVDAVIYSNSKLIVIGEEGYVASCNLSTGNWSKYDGTTENHTSNGSGPGIYNNGTILGGKNPTCTLRVGNTIFISGEYGRIASIDVITGGVTEYRGTTPDISSEISGPGYYYTGSDLANSNTTTSITNNAKHGIVIISGTDSFILSYSPESGEVLSPTTNKLYYIARRQSNYDYLSSLLIRVTKGTLNEYAPLYPPQENDSIFQMAYESSYYVYKNGEYVWRVSTGFDKIYFSSNGGITYLSSDIGNSEILPTIYTDTPRFMPVGIVERDGTFKFVDTIGGESFEIVTNVYEYGFTSEWRKLEKVYTQAELDSMYNFNTTKVSCKVDEKEYSIVDGYLYLNGEEKINIVDEIISKYLANEGFYGEIKVVGMYYTSNNILTFVISMVDKIELISVQFENIDLLFEPENYSITSKLLDLAEVRLENSKGVFTNNYESEKTIFHIDTDSVYVVVDYEGKRGFLGFNVVITSDNYDKNNYKHVLINLNGDVFGKYYINNSKLINVYDTKARLVSFDRENAEIQLAYYNTVTPEGVIKHVNSIHTYKELESTTFTPIRALTDAWKVCEVGMNQNINAFAIRLKFRNQHDDPNEDSITKQYTLRYQVLISNVSDGKYILYEVEKSTGISKTDNETKVVEPFIRVIAIDGFEDEILELYTSRMDSTRRSVFTKKPISSTADFIGEYDSKIETTYDFMTYVQRRSNSLRNLAIDTKYQIKIKPLNTLPANVDAEFFIEPYYNTSIDVDRSSSTSPIKSFVNNIDRSEINLASKEAKLTDAYIYGIPGLKGFIEKTQLDIGHMTKKPYTTNVNYYPQYDDREGDVSVGYADTYINIIRGNGHGLYDKISGVLSNVNNTWSIVPYSVNKEDLKFVFDEDGSEEINNMDTRLLKNTRGLYKMRNFSVFSKGVTNNADYYTDYENKGRIVKSEGTMSNSYGLFEMISSIDGNHKRIKPIVETKQNGVWKNTVNAFENIKERIYGKSYDIVDRFTVFEEPYHNIQSWWIPALGYVKNGNDRLLVLGHDETKSQIGIGRRYLPGDEIESFDVSDNSLIGKESPLNTGVVSALNGSYSSTREIAIQELVDEKFPLERWDGFEWADLCFIRKWRVVYTDDTIDHLYELEGPTNTSRSLVNTYTINHIPIEGSVEFLKIPESIRIQTPTINRNLYSYWDDFDFEGAGTQIFKCATKYSYVTHKWDIYKHEVQVNKYGYPNDTEGKEIYLVEDSNLARNNLISSEITEDKWYVPETNNVNFSSINHNNSKYHSSYMVSTTGKPETKNDLNISEFDYFPRSGIVGERITNLISPIADAVIEFNVHPKYSDISNTPSTYDKEQNLSVYLRSYNNKVMESNRYFTLYAVPSKLGNNVYKYNDALRVYNDGVGSEILKVSGNDDTVTVTYNNDLTTVSLNNAKPSGSYSRKESNNCYYLNYDSYNNKEYGYNGWKNGIGNIIFVRSSQFLGSILHGYQLNYANESFSGNFKYSKVSYKADATGNKNVNFGIVTSETSPIILDHSVKTNTVKYVKYCGLSSYKYLYAVEVDVNPNLVYTYNGVTSSNDRFQIIDGTRIDQKYIRSYYKYYQDDAQNNTGTPFKTYYADNRKTSSAEMYGSIPAYNRDNNREFLLNMESVPISNPTKDLVDKSFIGRQDPIVSTNATIKDSRISANYEYWYFYNDGSCDKKLETYQNKYTWIKFDFASTDAIGNTVDSDNNPILIPTDTTGSSFDTYSLRCLECYEFQDGYVVQHKTTRTVKDLKTIFGIDVINKGIELKNNGKNYVYVFNVELNGVDIINDHYTGNKLQNNISIKSAVDVQYAETDTKAGSAKYVATWQNDLSNSIFGSGLGNESGESYDPNIVVNLTLSLDKLVSSNSDVNVTAGLPWVTSISVPNQYNNSYKIPSEISIYVDENLEEKMSAENYSYNVSGDYSAALEIKAGVIGVKYSKITIIANALAK